MVKSRISVLGIPEEITPRAEPAGTGAMKKTIAASWVSSVDIRESADGLLIRVEIPEARKEGIEVALRSGYLSISGERQYPSPHNRADSAQAPFRNFQCLLRLPPEIDEEAISARYCGGILHLSLPKLKRAGIAGMNVVMH